MATFATAVLHARDAPNSRSHLRHEASSSRGRSPGVFGWQTRIESHPSSRQSSPMPTPTLSPSDSFSQNRSFSGLPVHYPLKSQPAIRPDIYPPEIIWLRAEIPEYIDISTSNKSRPPMVQCLRGTDGKVLSSAQYSGIKEAVRLVFMQDLAPLALADEQRKPGTDIKRSMMWYKDNHRERWWSAIAKIEYYQEVISLCANHWKAEQLLSNTITSYTNMKARRTDSPSPSTGKHRRSPSTASSHKKRRTRSKATPAEHPGCDAERVDDLNMVSLDIISPIDIRDGAPGNGGGDPNSRNAETDAEIAQLRFMKVLSTYENLRRVLQNEYGTIQNARQLLNAMEASTDVNHQEPSPEVVEFVKQIEEADPSAEFSEDDRNEGWGHYQFTAGELTCSSVLRNWRAIGNTGMARRLIAAAVKTCRVARSVCEL
ncbi:hypothetical protein Agabi119p4_8489 [Agaricus bisporus var. burnettii]|uniref:Uncharacterized protein n=1 Tax=Agaricus bisporus var. burnettii TaxID=192524 RepID=A0A8H7C6V0_AGABI|nr:hypothetical protein Agabi119p4_8489 [Agaricus bisporus var. burnettii]